MAPRAISTFLCHCFPVPPAVEPRLGSSTNDYTMIVNFSDPVTVGGIPQAETLAGSGDVGSGGTPNGGMVTVSGNTVTIPLTNVTSQQVIQVRLNGVNGSSSFIAIPSWRVLVGDTNGNGSVSACRRWPDQIPIRQCGYWFQLPRRRDGRRQHQRQRHWSGEIEVGQRAAS